jgi:glycosyltransferase involved in cell wall biosynthesis
MSAVPAHRGAERGMDPPLVSVLTPVYNGAKYLAECIDSVLAQTYDAWEYIIVDNCSTDETLSIAQQYQKKDKRIRIVINSHFVGAIDNHNIAFRNISTHSKYCKVVSADDWLYPECVTKLVELAECNPTVGIVQSYAINANGVRWTGLPHDATVVDGHEIGRRWLLGKAALGAPTSLLYRASLVRSEDPFLPGSHFGADAAACLNCLRRCDLGIVHQILSFERIHSEALTAKVCELDSYLLDRLGILHEHGSAFLTNEELNLRLREAWCEYYSVLATALVNLKGSEYWSYHRARLEDFGCSLYGIRMSKAVCVKLLDLVFNPKLTIEKILKRLSHS